MQGTKISATADDDADPEEIPADTETPNIHEYPAETLHKEDYYQPIKGNDDVNINVNVNMNVKENTSTSTTKESFHELYATDLEMEKHASDRKNAQDIQTLQELYAVDMNNAFTFSKSGNGQVEDAILADLLAMDMSVDDNLHV